MDNGMSEPRLLSADEVREIQERKHVPCWGIGGYPNNDALKEYAELCRTDIPNLCYTVDRLREEFHHVEGLFFETEGISIDGSGLLPTKEKVVEYCLERDRENAAFRRRIIELETDQLRDAEIARLAREYVAELNSLDVSDGREYTKAFDALIAAVEQEGR